ncbi:site-specific DNA-methyltransferase, partial [Limosilactobacillus reuteri]|uniref:site-specific DNA-methyltransferase n=1 Tax=Limosilactobacillus reuteri TaxID=1598 RepID=UPI0021D21E2F
MKIEPKIMEHTKTVLNQFGNKYLSDNGSIKKNKVISDLNDYNKELMSALLDDDLIAKNYTENVNSSIVFKLNQFISMFEYKDFWEDSFTKYSNKIGLVSDDKFIDESTDVVLDFPYKDTVLKANMSKDNNDNVEAIEPFLNETIAKPEINELFEPKILINAKKYDKFGVSNISKFNNDDNLILKGNNIIALHAIKDRYKGRVKLIYLDVPYNTGSDSFLYNDRYSNSTWLTFIKSRLEIAKSLLSDNGIIFVHLDDNEVKYLGVLMDEIFGKENFIELVTVVNNPRGRDYGGIANMHEFIYVYRRSEATKLNWIEDTTKRFPYKDEFGGFEIRELRNRNTAFNDKNRPNLCYPIFVDPNSKDENGFYNVSLTKDTSHTIPVLPKKSQGIQTVWRWGKEKFQKNANINVKAKMMKDGNFNIQEKYRKNQKMARSVWWDKEVNSERGTLHLKELFGKKVFAFPKPEGTLKRIIEIGTNENDIVMDFFMGSATTQAVALKMHRRFIGIEQMDYINTVSVPRLQKVIDGEQGGI